MDARKARDFTAVVCTLCLGTLMVTVFALRPEIGLLVAEYRYAAQLRSDDPAERLAAVVALGQLESTGAAAILVSELRTATGSKYLIDALTNSGRHAVDALTDLLDGDADRERKRWAVIALGRIGPSAAPAVPAIVHFLESDSNEWLCRASAFVALGRIGREAHLAVPLLLQRTTTETDADNRRHLAAALLRIDPESQAVREAATLLLTVPEEDEPSAASVSQALDTSSVLFDSEDTASAR